MLPTRFPAKAKRIAAPYVVAAYAMIVIVLLVVGSSYTFRATAVASAPQATTVTTTVAPVEASVYDRIAYDDFEWSTIVTVRHRASGKCYSFATRTNALTPLIEVGCP